jgi:uncharacterized protein YecE (DUF72 family)
MVLKSSGRTARGRTAVADSAASPSSSPADQHSTAGDSPDAATGQPAGAVRVGISGWRYPPWRSTFYPDDLPQRLELAYASRALPSIELNGSFYALQTPERYADWHDATPDGFVFSVKAPRYITHVRRLKDIGDALPNFFASGLFNLKAKLGPILWQFPPSMRFSAELFEPFLAALPQDTEQALALARRRSERMTGRARLAIDAARPMRHAVEIRHASFATPEFIALLRRHNVALVVADTAGKWPLLEDLCADFVYLRLHGDVELYASGYTDEALDAWAARIRAWSAGSQPQDARLASPEPPPAASARPVYCYFDNDIKVRAPYDAAGLLRRLGLDSGLDAQGRFAVDPHGPRRWPARAPG